MVELLARCSAVLPKEAVEKERPSKKGGEKKKHVEKNEPKTYVLSVFRDGAWYQLTNEEMADFMETNKEVTEYLTEPSLLNSIPVPPSAHIYDHWEKAAQRIIVHLWKMTGAHHFHYPVDPVALHIPDYYTIVKKPMDFGTIRQKLSEHSYANCKEFAEDVDLVFSNCVNYNGEMSDYGKLARNVREEFKKQCHLYHLSYYMPS